jgi:hypothetical protein
VDTKTAKQVERSVVIAKLRSGGAEATRGSPNFSGAQRFGEAACCFAYAPNDNASLYLLRSVGKGLGCFAVFETYK